MFYLNAQSVTSNIEKIQQFCNENKPLMLICTETHITTEINESEYEVENYNIANCMSNSRNTGGVIIFVKKPIKYKILLNVSQLKF